MAIAHDSILVQIFSQRLKSLREASGLSQEDLASRSGLDRTYISGCERGIRNPTLVSVERLAGALQVKPAAMLEGEGGEVG
ncbi:MAG: helix-turn-helix transcriptional regulator [Caulobacterales bacterium]|nr:helix-turn-helix transcriptional regulator [Caulobacterales bacterium]